VGAKGTKSAGYLGSERLCAGRNETGIVPEAVAACQRELANREVTLAAEAKVAGIVGDVVV
jgi:hypothetical protein